MSYYRSTYRRRYYNRTSWTPTIPAKVEVLRQTAQNDSRQFVLNKFFTLSRQEYSDYSAWYLRKHGASAHSYLQNTYYSWKNKRTGMSAQTCMRVLEGVPRVMSRPEQFQLLRFHLPSLLCSPGDRARNSTIDSSELATFYSKNADAITAQPCQISWFVSAVFSESELKSFRNILNYILLRRLEESFTNVKNDLIKLHNTLSKLDAKVKLLYQINFLGANVAVSDVDQIAAQRINITFPSLPAEDTSNPEFQAILADTTLTDAIKYSFSTGVQTLALQDLDNVISQIEGLGPQHEVESDLAIDGKGGVAQLRIIKISEAKLRSEIAISYAWMIAILIGFTVVAKLSLEGRSPQLVPIFFAGLFGFTCLTGLFGSIKHRKETLQNYGQRKSKVFAKD